MKLIIVFFLGLTISIVRGQTISGGGVGTYPNPSNDISKRSVEQYHSINLQEFKKETGVLIKKYFSVGKTSKNHDGLFQK